MRPNDVEKTAFAINNGKYEFLRMPFGLKNGTAIFQRAINDVLRSEIGKICYIYMDDMIVFGKNLEEHLHNLRIVLKLLSNANLKVQIDKSEFLHNKIDFLGYIIKPNYKKIEGIKHFLEPTNIKQLRGFLGMVGYYRRFVKDFARIVQTLINLLRDNENKSSVTDATKFTSAS